MHPGFILYFHHRVNDYSHSCKKPTPVRVPYLRRKLFEPFKPSLLADAGLDNFDDHTYFSESIVKLPPSGETLNVTEALPSIKGQIIL